MRSQYLQKKRYRTDSEYRKCIIARATAYYLEHRVGIRERRRQRRLAAKEEIATLTKLASIPPVRGTCLKCNVPVSRNCVRCGPCSQKERWEREHPLGHQVIAHPLYRCGCSQCGQRRLEQNRGPLQRYRSTEKFKETSRRYQKTHRKEIRAIAHKHYWGNHESTLLKLKKRYMGRREKHMESTVRCAKAFRRQVKISLGGRCACCGESELEFLQLDHVNEDGYKDRLRYGGGVSHRSYRDAMRLIKASLPVVRYQLLCANCNLSKHYGKGVCVHRRVKLDASQVAILDALTTAPAIGESNMSQMSPGKV